MTAVALGFVEPFAALEFEVDHFLIAMLVEHGRGDGSTFNHGITHAVFAIGAIKKDLIQRNGATHFSIELLDVEFYALGNAVLFAAGFDDCESHMPEPDEVGMPAGRPGKAGQAGGEIPTPPWRVQVVFMDSSGSCGRSSLRRRKQGS